MNKYLKRILILGITTLLCMVIYRACKFAMYPLFEHYSKKDLIENYDLKQKEINELFLYAKNITNDGNKYVQIEFTNNRILDMFFVEMDSATIEKMKSEYAVQPTYWREGDWNLKINSQKVDTLLNCLDWTRETLKILKTKLDAANCISIESNKISPKSITIGFKRSGMGKYYYKIFDEPLTDSLILKYNDGCTYIFYKDNIVLEYGGGAFGMQCFETHYNKELTEE